MKKIDKAYVEVVRTVIEHGAKSITVAKIVRQFYEEGRINDETLKAITDVMIATFTE